MPSIQTTSVFTLLDEAVSRGYTTVSEQGSARSGKTYNTGIWIVVRCCLAFKGSLTSVVRATLPALKGSVLRDFEDILTRIGIWEPKRFNKSELIYHFENGSELEFFSCDNEKKLRGRKRDFLFVNEANELRFIEWQQLQMRTTRLSVIDYNPSFTDEHWICALNKDPRTFHFVTTYRENPFLEQRVIDEIESLRDKNGSLWRIYGEGMQAQIEGLVFPRFETVDEIPPSARKRWYGVDYGYEHDPTAIVEVAVYGKSIYIDEKCYRTHMLTGEIINAFKALRPRKIVSESADPRLIQEIFRAGLDIHPVVKFKDSITAGIAKMQEYDIFVTNNSYNIRKELSNYTYAQDKDGHWLNTPIDAYNHAIDAVRYVIMNEVMGGVPRPVNLKRVATLAY